MQEFRISAAAIVIHPGKVLLVRYGSQPGKSDLVGPGGGVQVKEDLQAGLVREVKEETGLEVKPIKMLCVEDLLSCKYRMIKVWFLCSLVGGRLAQTEEALAEGISQVGWFDKKLLKSETVYPAFLKIIDWTLLESGGWSAGYLGLK